MLLLPLLSMNSPATQMDQSRPPRTWLVPIAHALSTVSERTDFRNAINPDVHLHFACCVRISELFPAL